MFQYTSYPDRAFLRISGAEMQEFLQGIITNDMRLLADKPGIFAAMLTPQGKLLHDFFLIKQGDGLLLELPADALESITKKLKLYRLRSRVDMADVSQQWKLIVAWGNIAQTMLPQGSISLLDPRLRGLGLRIYCPTSVPFIPGPEGREAAFETYDRHRLELAIPDGSRDASDRNVVLELGYDQLGGVSFTKGCFIGQEVTARMHHRHVLKKCLFSIRSNGPALPAYGTPVLAGDKEIGDMRSSRGDIGLAQLRIEEWQAAQSAGMALQAGDVTITATLPDYMTAKLEKIAAQSHPQG